MQRILQRRVITSLLCILLLVAMADSLPTTKAELGTGEDEERLNLVCDSDDDCSLSNGISGEEVVSRQENDANPLNPTVVSLEFTMQPSQSQMALIPDSIDELVIDLRVTEDVLGWSKPDLDVDLKIGPSENFWNIEGEGPGLATQPSAYTLQNEALDLSNGRLLDPAGVVRLRLTFQLDRPATWELHLRSLSYFEIDIAWSVNPAHADVDEPSSQQSPRSTDEVEVWHDGALVGDDRDCWNFDLERNELFNIIIIWDLVPIEIEQPHDAPDFVGPDNRQTSDPSVHSSHDGERLRITFQYRGLEEGEHTLCWAGKDDRFQSYSWMGRVTYEGIGPNDPNQFSTEASWDSGTTIVGYSDSAVAIEEGGIISLAFGLLMFTGVLGSAAVNPTWRWTRRLMLPLSGLLILFGGVVHPIMMWSEAVKEEGTIDVERMLNNRLEQVWQVVSPSTPQETMAEQLGSTFGMLIGERLLMDLEIDEAIPMEDDRYQLHSPDLDGIRIDRLIFNHLNTIGAGHNNDGLLPQRSVNFVLHAGRALALDLLMLEALLVVDEIPTHNTLHIDWTMTSAGASGSYINPAWMTRPEEIKLQQWSRLQASLFPDMITISYCDCGLDQMDFTWVPSQSLDAQDLPSVSGITTPSGLGDSANWLMFTGILLILVTAVVETRRRGAARRLVSDFLG